MPTIDAEDPLAVDVVDVIHTGDVPRLKRLLAEHPGLAEVRLGDDDPDGMNRSLLHIATDWPGHFPNVATTIEVLVVDRSTFPSDTLSTHVVHPPAIAALHRWGLLDRVVASGCPPLATYSFDFGPITISGSPGTPDSPVGYCPRRTVLDKILVDGAAEAGAEVREGFTVKEILIEDGRVVGVRGHEQGGPDVTERADVVVGAD